MDDIGADLIGHVRQNIAAGHEPRIIFDNLDFKILVNIILTNHRNSDHHWIAHFLTFDRVSSQNLDDSKPQVADVKDYFENIEYLLNKDELEKLRSDFIVLVARVLKEFFKCVEALGDVIPKHISHRCSCQYY